MQKVFTVSLNNTLYQLEEDAYAAVRSYLDHAASRLRNNPDLVEILADLERAIDEKIAALSVNDVRQSNRGRILRLEQVQAILQEIGPVGDDDPGTAPPEDPAPHQGAGRRLYRIREGQMIGGVCTGLAAYFGVDVIIARLAFVALTILTNVFAVLAYLLLMVSKPYKEPGTADGSAPFDRDPARKVAILFVLGVVAAAGFLGLLLFTARLGLRAQELIFFAIPAAFVAFWLLVITIVVYLVVVEVKRRRSGAS